MALREKGVRHDLIDAVFALGGEDDLVRLLARVDALTSFLASEDGRNLLVAYRRASNIVTIEEKKDKATYDGAVDPALLSQAEEQKLAKVLAEAQAGTKLALGEGRLHRRHDGAGSAARSGGCLLRQGDRQYRRQSRAGQSPAAVVADPRHARRGGRFFARRGMKKARA